MNKKHFRFAGDLILELMIKQGLGVQNLEEVETYKYFVKLFTNSGKDFVKDKFNAYIRKNYNKLLK